MCYSGRCRWENHMGDCRFPTNKKVKEKYPMPICEIPTCEEECTEEHKRYCDEVYEDIQKILNEEKMKNNLTEVANLIILQIDHNRECGKSDKFTIDEIVDIIKRSVINESTIIEPINPEPSVGVKEYIELVKIINEQFIMYATEILKIPKEKFDE